MKRKEMQEKEKQNYIQKGRTEITLKEHLGIADLPVPHYSPGGRSSPEMALSADH